MAPMAMQEPVMSAVAVWGRQRSWRMAWLLWIVVSVIGAVIAALIGWQIRTHVGRDFAYAATVVSAVIAAGSQWFVLRRYRLDVDWWVPATVVAYLIDVMIVEPSVLNRFIAAPDSSVAAEIAILGGALTLAAGGLVLGTAQALVLRPAAGDIAWAWIPATVVGGALAGGITTVIGGNVLTFPYVVALSGLSALGALLTAACQVPVVLRVLR
jgi:hypothetical protein